MIQPLDLIGTKGGPGSGPRKGSGKKLFDGVKFRKITANRDEKGNILTYTTTTESGVKVEKNTLKEAKIMAAIID